MEFPKKYKMKKYIIYLAIVLLIVLPILYFNHIIKTSTFIFTTLVLIIPLIGQVKKIK